MQTSLDAEYYEEVVINGERETLMGRIIALSLIVYPFLEIAMFIWVGGKIGILATIGSIILAVILGIAVLRWQGLGLVTQTRAQLARGEVPAHNIANGVMLAIAGLLLLLPGFLSDIAAFLLLIPFVRQFIFSKITKNMVVVKSQSYGNTYDGATYRDETYKPTPVPKSIDLGPDDYRQE